MDASVNSPPLNNASKGALSVDGNKATRGLAVCLSPAARSARTLASWGIEVEAPAIEGERPRTSANVREQTTQGSVES